MEGPLAALGNDWREGEGCWDLNPISLLKRGYLVRRLCQTQTHIQLTTSRPTQTILSALARSPHTRQNVI